MAVRPRFLERLPLTERTFVLSALRDETVGGALLLGATVVALLWANLAGGSYEQVRTTVVGPHALHLDLDLAAWAADGLLAVFFLVAGLELKRELVVGQLRNPAQAVLPVVAALGGMVAPALVYLAVTRGADGTAPGWAVPTATDIAFALAVLAVAAPSLPTPLRAFLLTLAVVDDLGAILIIALFFTSSLSVLPLLGALALLAVYAVAQRRRVSAWWLYVPLGLAVWALVHASGVHATVAGVALGLLTRVRHDPGEHESPAERLEHRLRPLSAGLCVPLFALLSAGVALSAEAFGSAAGDLAAVGVVAGLVAGKAVGVFGGTWLTARFTRAELDPALSWGDLFGVAVLSGIGFTVSLLIAELAFDDQPGRAEHVKAGILVGSVLAAVLATVLLRRRNRHYRVLAAAEDADLDADGVPDVYQRATDGQTGDQGGRETDRP
ncbi:MAG: Na+/H+ antiporter NhaA [Motilibacteraceae bacterium]